jgi:hypothetical protein
MNHKTLLLFEGKLLPFLFSPVQLTQFPVLLVVMAAHKDATPTVVAGNGLTY